MTLVIHCVPPVAEAWQWFMKIKARSGRFEIYLVFGSKPPVTWNYQSCFGFLFLGCKWVPNVPCLIISTLRELVSHVLLVITSRQNANVLNSMKALPLRYFWKHRSRDIISYPLFADGDTGIYPHAALQYHARPKAKRGIAMLSVDKFPYPRKQTRGNEFIPCSNNICDILKRFRSFEIPAITLIWPKSPYKHSVTRSYRSCKESGRRSESPLWRHQWRSFVFISHADDVKREIRLHISRLLSNQKRESARSMG